MKDNMRRKKSQLVSFCLCGTLAFAMGVNQFSVSFAEESMMYQAECGENNSGAVGTDIVTEEIPASPETEGTVTEIPESAVPDQAPDVQPEEEKTETEIPETEKGEKPEAEVPEAGETETPETGVPETGETETPETEVPEAGETETPETEVPETGETEAPETEVPEAGETEAPETPDADETESPEKENPDSEITGSGEKESPETEVPDTGNTEEQETPAAGIQQNTDEVRSGAETPDYPSIAKPQWQTVISFEAASSGKEIKLTKEELSKILKGLPAQLDPARKCIVIKASSLVGRVHYFWGGKSNVIGWDRRWGKETLVTSAGSMSTGTSDVFGLDCSGYINWVFNNAAGMNVNEGIGNGTTGQWGMSIESSWKDAQPGDLVFLNTPDYDGVMNHVGIVVGWDEDGEVLAAHCSGSWDNVVVTKAQATGFRYVRTPMIYQNTEFQEAAKAELLKETKVLDKNALGNH